MERYNRDSDHLFDLPNPSLHVFCEHLQKEAKIWDTQHKDARHGIFINCQKRKMENGWISH